MKTSQKKAKPMKKKPMKGFSLLELLIVVSIILVIAVLAIPSLLASKRNANQTSAVASLTTLNKAMSQYMTEFPDAENTGTSTTWAMATPYADLGGSTTNCSKTPPTISPAGACLLDPVLAAASAAPGKDSYVFTMVATGPVQWTINADPVGGDVTGNTKHFFVDQTNVVRYSLNAAATTTSPALGQ